MKIEFAKPVCDKEMQEAAIGALQNEFFVLGESVFKFEEEFARYIGTKRAVSTSSGTDALFLALNAYKVPKGASVACPTNSFIATANAVMMNGSVPQFYDIYPRTGLIDITSRRLDYAAVIPVHIYGNPCRMEEIVEDAKKHSAPVIEDACQAHGAAYNGKKVGSIGHAGCFSFYTTKNMTVCGDGGMVTLNDEKLADEMVSVRNCGRKTKYEHDKLGYTKRLNTVNAAIGRVQLKRLDSWNEKRQHAAKTYRNLLLEDVLLDETEASSPVYHLFVIKTDKRDALMGYLSERGIGAMIHYPIPIHQQPIYKSELVLENAELFARQIVSLPMHPQITDEEIRYVSECVNEVLR